MFPFTFSTTCRLLPSGFNRALMVVILDTPSSAVLRRVLASHAFTRFPFSPHPRALRFPPYFNWTLLPRHSAHCVICYCRRGLKSYRCRLSAKKCSAVRKGIGGVMCDRVTVGSFNKNRNVNFLLH